MKRKKINENANKHSQWSFDIPQYTGKYKGMLDLC